MPVKHAWEVGNLGVFRVSGRLGQDEIKPMQDECEAVIRTLGHIRLLIILDDFQGWEKGGDWSDWSFAERNDPFIDKFAIVGDEHWRDLAYAFVAKGLRPVPIEYFGAGDEARARDWLDR